MEFFVIILIGLCLYFWYQNKKLKDQNFNKAADHKKINKDIYYEDKKNLKNQDSQINSRRQNNRPPSFRTGIPGLDGPGVYARLFQYGQSGGALYLLYSQQHKAYKVGHIRPAGLVDRIKMIKEEVPDISLNGLKLFTGDQNAYNREQEILEIYKRQRYYGLKGRNSGITEWLKVRPSRPNRILTVERIEEEYIKDKYSKAEEIIVKDIYTVYLFYSNSQKMYFCSWCKTNRIQEKIKRERKDFSEDVELISRMPFESKDIARATRNSFNEITNTYRRVDREEIIEWTKKKDYVAKFKNWDSNAKKI